MEAAEQRGLPAASRNTSSLTALRTASYNRLSRAFSARTVHRHCSVQTGTAQRPASHHIRPEVSGNRFDPTLPEDKYGRLEKAAAHIVRASAGAVCCGGQHSGTICCKCRIRGGILRAGRAPKGRLPEGRPVFVPAARQGEERRRQYGTKIVTRVDS